MQAHGMAPCGPLHIFKELFERGSKTDAKVVLVSYGSAVFHDIPEKHV